MTTHTNSTTASIDVFPKHRLNPINRNIYSGFTEHMGRCIYGGIYDPENPNKDLIDENGFRVDVIEALKPLQIPVFRYPGPYLLSLPSWSTNKTQAATSVQHTTGRMALARGRTVQRIQNWHGVLSRPTSLARMSS